MNIEHHPVAGLRPLERNPRSITDADMARLKASIRQFGLFKPLLVWTHPDGRRSVIGGNQRLAALDAMRAAGELPLVVKLASGDTTIVDADRVPCLPFRGTEAEARAVALRDNNSDGEWDWDALPQFVSDLAVELGSTFGEVDLAAFTGFDESTLKDLHRLAGARDVGLDKFTGNGEPAAPASTTTTGDKPNEYVTRQGAKFVCGNIRGKVPVALYDRFVARFTAIGSRLNTTDIPTILARMLDDLEERS